MENNRKTNEKDNLEHQKKKNAEYVHNPRLENQEDDITFKDNLGPPKYTNAKSVPEFTLENSKDFSGLPKDTNAEFFLEPTLENPTDISRLPKDTNSESVQEPTLENPEDAIAFEDNSGLPKDTNAESVQNPSSENSKETVKIIHNSRKMIIDESGPHIITNAEAVQAVSALENSNEVCKWCKIEIEGNFDDHLFEAHYKQRVFNLIPSTIRGCSGCAGADFATYDELVAHMVRTHKICRKFYDRDGRFVLTKTKPEIVKTYFECLCCRMKIDSRKELRAHLALHHFKNFIIDEIKISIKNEPYCPYQNCDFKSGNNGTISEHFGIVHKPDVLDGPNLIADSSRKCNKCFLGPFVSLDDLLIHIGLNHEDVVDFWIKKLMLEKTLEPKRKVTMFKPDEKRPVPVIDLD